MDLSVVRSAGALSLDRRAVEWPQPRRQQPSWEVFIHSTFLKQCQAGMKMGSHMFSKAFISFSQNSSTKYSNCAVYLSGSSGFCLLSFLEEEHANRRFPVARLKLSNSGTAGFAWFCLTAITLHRFCICFQFDTGWSHLPQRREREDYQTTYSLCKVVSPGCSLMGGNRSWVTHRSICPWVYCWGPTAAFSVGTQPWLFDSLSKPTFPASLIFSFCSAFVLST